jgi:hypothetical protein
VIRDQLAPQDRWAERNNGEDECTDVNASLRGWSKLGRGSKGCKLVDTGSDACENHAGFTMSVTISFHFTKKAGNRTDERVHVLRGRADDHANDDECGP